MSKFNFFSLPIFFICSILFFSCTEDNNTLNSSEFTTNSINQAELEIDYSEIPELSELSLKKIHDIKDMSYDNTRTPILDIQNSILKIPFNSNLIEENKQYPPVAMSIKIAKKYPKPDSGCLKCVDCIGFRCKPNKPTPIKVMKYSDVEKALKNKRNDTEKSVDRDQYFYVMINTKDRVLEFHSKQNIDWRKLQ